MGSKAKESAKALSLAFVLLDFQYAGVRRRAECTRRRVDMQQFREVSRTRTIYSTESHTSDFNKRTNNCIITLHTATSLGEQDSSVVRVPVASLISG